MLFLMQPTPQQLRHHLSTHASRWSESDAMIRFRSQPRCFDRGSRSFLACCWPLTQELIAMTTRKSRHARQKRKDTGIAITAHQLAHAKNIALRQVTSTSTEVWKNEQYGHAPWEKPKHLIRIAMENFNSLCILLGNAKIMAINSLTPKSVPAGTKLVLFGRYVLNIYVGIVGYFLRSTKLSAPKSTYRHNAQIGNYRTILTSAKKIRFWPSTHVID
jgi:hypothetical protein